MFWFTSLVFRVLLLVKESVNDYEHMIMRRHYYINYVVRVVLIVVKFSEKNNHACGAAYFNSSVNFANK